MDDVTTIRCRRGLLLAMATVVLACTMDNPAFDPLEGGVLDESEASVTTEVPGDGDGDPSTGDGDGEPPGDGDGEPPGDGDGEPPGDGDGEPPGDGDGDEPPACEFPEVDCGGFCVDLNHDDEHCGACNEPCETGCLWGACFEQPYHLIFTTSELFTGNLGGLEGADARCQEAAIDAELEGAYVAWLSTEQVGPADRIIPFAGDYRTPAGSLVANDWSQLISGQLINPIDSDEYADDPPFTIVCVDGEVWTNTNFNGTPRSQDDCFEWTSAAADASSSVGWWWAVGPGWTESECPEVACSTQLPLYCVQQG